jgi:hypothetical protein
MGKLEGGKAFYPPSNLLYNNTLSAFLQGGDGKTVKQPTPHYYLALLTIRYHYAYNKLYYYYLQLH